MGCGSVPTTGPVGLRLRAVRAVADPADDQRRQRIIKVGSLCQAGAFHFDSHRVIVVQPQLG